MWAYLAYFASFLLDCGVHTPVYCRKKVAILVLETFKTSTMILKRPSAHGDFFWHPPYKRVPKQTDQNRSGCAWISPRWLQLLITLTLIETTRHLSFLPFDQALNSWMLTLVSAINLITSVGDCCFAKTMTAVSVLIPIKINWGCHSPYTARSNILKLSFHDENHPDLQHDALLTFCHPFEWRARDR